MKLKINTICFDMWGTLCEGGGGKAWNDLQNTLGADLIDEKIFQKQGLDALLKHSWDLKTGIKKLARTFNLKTDKTNINTAYRSWWYYVEKSKIYPETIAVLEELLKRGIRLIIISNTDTESFYYEINKFKLKKYFEKFFISAKLGSLKHEGKMFAEVQNYLKTAKDRILLVDDSFEHGVLPARKFGWRALWVARGKKYSGRRNDKFKINNLRSIFDFL